jgi:hypothetical protein
MKNLITFFFLVLLTFTFQAVLSQIPTYDFTPDSIRYDTSEIHMTNATSWQYFTYEYEGAETRRKTTLSSWPDEPEKIRSKEVLTIYPLDGRKPKDGGNRCDNYPYKMKIELTYIFNYCGELWIEGANMYDCRHDPMMFSASKTLKHKEYRVAPCP